MNFAGVVSILGNSRFVTFICVQKLTNAVKSTINNKNPTIFRSVHCPFADEDDMSVPLSYGNRNNITMFSLGVGDINESSLNEIAGSADRKFYVKDFEDLNSHLIGIIQNRTCGPRVNECGDPSLNKCDKK
jgi:hypothetical protein